MANLNDIKLTPKGILKKQFNTKMKGYNQEEVDAYLDQVISDYENFATIIGNLQNQISKLKTEVNTDSMPSTESINNSFSPEITTNVEIIQRISTLERKVYNIEQKMNTKDKTYTVN